MFFDTEKTIGSLSAIQCDFLVVLICVAFDIDIKEVFVEFEIKASQSTVVSFIEAQ